MGVVSVVLESPTLLVVVIGLSFGVVAWLYFNPKKKAAPSSPQQVPKRYPASSNPDEKKSLAHDRRVTHARGRSSLDQLISLTSLRSR